MRIEHKMTKITPSTAFDMLDKLNMHNRPLSHATVMTYVDRMKRGIWEYDGTGIVISDRNRLLNGQHTLWACYESGVTIYTDVQTGVPDHTFKTIDTGKPRSHSDVVGCNPDLDIPNGNLPQVSAAANLCILYKTKSMSKGKVDKADTSDFVEKNPEIIDWVARAKKNKGWTKSYTSPLVALCYLGSRKHPKKAEEFFDKFVSGADMAKGCPILALRFRLGTEKHMSRSERFSFFVLTWNAFVQGRTLTRLQAYRSEEFPKLIGA